MSHLWVDSHCHLNLFSEHEVNDLVDQAVSSGVYRMLCVGTESTNSQTALAIAHKHESVFASVGLHPCEANFGFDHHLEKITSMLTDKSIVAIGETGLDYYHQDNLNKDRQAESFVQQISLAKSHKKPLVIHTRSSFEDTCALLKTHAADEVGGVFHCFSGTKEEAFKVLDLGFYISFSGILTFKNAPELRECAKALPRDRVLIETDAPYLSPVPYRSKPNRPEWVIKVAETLAELWSLPLEVLSDQIKSNADDLLGWDCVV